MARRRGLDEYSGRGDTTFPDRKVYTPQKVNPDSKVNRPRGRASISGGVAATTGQDAATLQGADRSVNRPRGRDRVNDVLYPNRRGLFSPEARRTGLGSGSVTPAVTSPEARRRDLGSGSARSTTSPEARRTGLGGGSANNPRNQAGSYGLGARPVSPAWEALGYNVNPPVRTFPNPSEYVDPVMEDRWGVLADLVGTMTSPFINAAQTGYGAIERALDGLMMGEHPWRQNAAGQWYGGPYGVNPEGVIPGRPMPGVFSGGQQVFDDGTGNFYRYESDPRTSENYVSTPANPYDVGLWGYGYDTHQYGRDRLQAPQYGIQYGERYPLGFGQ